MCALLLAVFHKSRLVLTGSTTGVSLGTWLNAHVARLLWLFPGIKRRDIAVWQGGHAGGSLGTFEEVLLLAAQLRTLGVVLGVPLLRAVHESTGVQRDRRHVGSRNRASRLDTLFEGRIVKMLVNKDALMGGFSVGLL